MDVKLEMDYPRKDGASLREHAEQLGKPELIKTPDIPEETRHIWDWFWELDAGRQCGMTINPLSYEAIAAWKELTKADPNPWEIKAIKALDKRFLSYVSKVK